MPHLEWGKGGRGGEEGKRRMKGTRETGGRKRSVSISK